MTAWWHRSERPHQGARLDARPRHDPPLLTRGGRLFGYTDFGYVIQIDPATATSTLLASTGMNFYGASAR
jgi:hypothetical protein